MNVILTSVALIILVIGFYFGQKKENSQVDDFSEKKVIKDQIEGTTSKITSIPYPTIPITPSIQEEKLPAPTKLSINHYKYPDSEVLFSSEDTLRIRSRDNSDIITSWYKEKSTKEGMNVRTFVTTKTNDDVLNKLVAADGKKEVRVEISKTGDNDTFIDILIKQTD